VTLAGAECGAAAVGPARCPPFFWSMGWTVRSRSIRSPQKSRSPRSPPRWPPSGFSTAAI